MKCRLWAPAGALGLVLAATLLGLSHGQVQAQTTDILSFARAAARPAVGATDAGKSYVATADLFPLHEGDEWGFRRTSSPSGDVDFLVRRTGGAADFHGQTAFSIADTSASGARTTYWYRDGSGDLLRPGETDAAGNEYQYLPAVLALPAEVYEGQHIVTSGEEQINGEPYQDYTVNVEVAQTGEAVTLPSSGLSFTGCVELTVATTLGGEATGTTTEVGLVLAPGVGVVREDDYQVEPAGQPVLASETELEWASVGGVAYGENAADATASYFPLAEGDLRIYSYPDGDLSDEEVGTETTVDGRAVWPLSANGHGPDTVRWWSRDDGATDYSGLEAADKLFLTPATELLGATARAGQVFHSEGTYAVDGSGSYPYAFDVTVLAADGACTTLAGDFDHCLVLERLGSMGAQPYVEAVQETWYLAPGVGVVKLDDAEEASESYELSYAKVGGVAFGTPPGVADTTSYFPLAAGDRWLYHWDDGHVDDVQAGTQASFGGAQAWPFCATADDSRWWLRDDGTTKLAGFVRDYLTGGYTLTFSPAVTVMPKQVALGDVFRTTGTATVDEAATGGATATEPFDLSVQVVDVSRSLTVAGGTFDGCLVLRITGTIGAGADGGTTGSLGAETLDQEWTLAPGVGVVKMTGQSPAGTDGEMVYAKVDGTEWGVFPATVDTAGFFPLQAGNQYVYRLGTGALSKVDVGTAASQGATTAFPFATYLFGAASAAQTDWWCASAGDSGNTVCLWRSQAVEDGSDQTYLPSPPLLPPTVYAGMVLRSSGDVYGAGGSGDKVGSYRWRATVTAINASASPPAGAFGGCLQVREELATSVGVPVVMSRTLTLAKDVGIVAYDETAPSAEAGELAWGKVGGKQYGTDPPQVGDANGDGVIDQHDADLLIEALLGGHYDKALDLAPYTGTPPAIVPQPDGKIDGADLAAFMALWKAAHPGGG